MARAIDYNIEDFPQAQWNSGAGRIDHHDCGDRCDELRSSPPSAGHFSAQDVNDTIAGPGIPSNTFIKSVTADARATLDKVVGSPGVAKGAVLTVNNSDGRTFTDALSPATTATGGTSTVATQTTHTSGAQASTITTLTVVASGTTNFPSKGSLSVPTSGSGAVSPAKFTYTGVSGGNKFTGLHRVSGAGTMATNSVVTLTGITSVSGLQTAHVASRLGNNVRSQWRRDRHDEHAGRYGIAELYGEDHDRAHRRGLRIGFGGCLQHGRCDRHGDQGQPGD